MRTDPPQAASDILLFDLDGVLLNSAGYHRSLQEAVRQMARGLGFGDQTITRADIELFEALDITAEWDSAAMCAALMLLTARQADPSASLPARPPIPERAPHGLPFPDLRAFLATIERSRQTVADPVGAATSALKRHLDGATPQAAQAALSFLRQARDPDVSLTFCLVQLFNLGQARYEAIYGRPGGIEAESFLERYDRPTLSKSERDALSRWLGAPGRAAAVVTNRPSRSDRGIFNTPEAEIGTAVAGVADLPRIASGHLGEAAMARGLDPQTFLKPSAVHVLAALACALGFGSSESVEAAIALVEAPVAGPMWRPLEGSRVRLFEDAAKGLYGARAAADELAQRGVHVDLRLYGIAETEIRSEALGAAGAKIFPHVRLALEDAAPGWSQKGGGRSLSPHSFA